MRTTETKNTAFTTRVTKAPALCPKCSTCVSSGPGWLEILNAIAPGRGVAEPVLGTNEIARRIKKTPQRASQMLKQMVDEGVMEKTPFGYRRTWYGRQLIGRWKSAGWTEGRG